MLTLASLSFEAARARGTWGGERSFETITLSGFEKIGGGMIRLDQLYFKYLNDPWERKYWLVLFRKIR